MSKLQSVSSCLHVPDMLMWATATDCSCSCLMPKEDTCAPGTMLSSTKLVTLVHTHCDTMIGVQCQ